VTTSEPKTGLRDLGVCDDGRNPQATLAAIAFGDQPLTGGQRPERPRPQFLPKFGKELLDATRFDVAAGVGIDPGGS
jgi:hypothetical protein